MKLFWFFILISYTYYVPTTACAIALSLFKLLVHIDEVGFSKMCGRNTKELGDLTDLVHLRKLMERPYLENELIIELIIELYPDHFWAMTIILTPQLLLIIISPIVFLQISSLCVLYLVIAVGLIVYPIKIIIDTINCYIIYIYNTYKDYMGVIDILIWHIILYSVSPKFALISALISISVIAVLVTIVGIIRLLIIIVNQLIIDSRNYCIDVSKRCYKRLSPKYQAALEDAYADRYYFAFLFFLLLLYDSFS